MHMMGTGQCYFMVLSPSGYQVTIEPYAMAARTATAAAINRSNVLLDQSVPLPRTVLPCMDLDSPCVRRFDVLIPAFRQRDDIGIPNTFQGWLPRNPKRPVRDVE